MGGPRDDVTLTERERQAFATIASELTGPDPKRKRPWGRVTPAVPVVLVVAGAVAALVTFTRWLWLAAVALGVMGLGLSLTARPAAARLQALTTGRRGRHPDHRAPA